MHTQATDPKEIVDYTMQAIKYLAEEKEIFLRLDIPENLPFVNADAEKTAWVLINLVSNAIHYSENKKEIGIEVIPGNNNVKFSVRDYGAGIEEMYLGKVFEKFFRIPGSIRAGTGLGLAISKDFITKQKGKIWVESKVGEGSVFSFTLPVAGS